MPVHTNIAQADGVAPVVRDGGVSFLCGTGEGDASDLISVIHFGRTFGSFIMKTKTSKNKKGSSSADSCSDVALHGDGGSHSLDQ